MLDKLQDGGGVMIHPENEEETTQNVLLTEIIIEFIDRFDGLVNPSNPESCALCGGSREKTDTAPYQEVTYHREACLLDRARAAIQVR